MGYNAGWFPWDGWEGWFIDSRLLYSPQFKDGYTPEQVEMIGYQRAEIGRQMLMREFYKKIAV